MNKTILVIGSVTAEQYQAARIAVLRQGDKPRIIHVSAEDLLVQEEVLQEKYGDMSTDEFAMLSEDESDHLIKAYAKRHYSQYGDIASIVVSNEVYNHHCFSGSFTPFWYMDGFFDKIPTWRVHETGYVELHP